MGAPVSWKIRLRGWAVWPDRFDRAGEGLHHLGEKPRPSEGLDADLADPSRCRLRTLLRAQPSSTSWPSRGSTTSTSPPIRRFISAGVPWAAARPWCISTSVRPRSASSSMCVVSRMVSLPVRGALPPATPELAAARRGRARRRLVHQQHCRRCSSALAISTRRISLPRASPLRPAVDRSGISAPASRPFAAAASARPSREGCPAPAGSPPPSCGCQGLSLEHHSAAVARLVRSKSGNAHLALLGLQQSGQNSEERRLAAPVGTQHAAASALLDLKREPIESVFFP